MAHPPSDDEGFLGRWSRLKQRARDEDAQAPEAAPARPVAPVEGAGAEEKAAREKSEEKKQPFDLSELPSVESLTKDSDYAPFMRAEVPEDLRQKALRRLWVSDPVLSAPEILDMHNLDYNNVPIFPEGIKTLYRVGQGMLDALEQNPDESPAAQPGATAEVEPPSESDAASQQVNQASAEKTPEKPSES